MGRGASAAFFATALFACSVGAAPRSVTLTWVLEPGTETCPDERWIRQAVSARLGANPFTDDAEIRVDARIAKAARGLVGTIAVTDKDGAKLGRRELASVTGDCLELASAMELAMAIAADPQYLTRPAAEPKPTEKPIEKKPVEKPIENPPAPPPSPLALQLDVGPIGAFGLSPNVVPGLVVGVSLRWPRLSIGLEGRADLASTVAFGPGRVTSSVLLGSLIPCARISRFSICGVVSAGAIQVTGEIVAPTRRESSPLVLAGLRGLAQFHLTKALSIQPFVDVHAVLIRTTVASGDIPVWVTSPVGACAGLSLGIHIF